MTRVEVIPCLMDNYAYLVINDETKKALLVDVPESAPINAALEAAGVELEAILLTHHHFDHIDGLETLNRGKARVYGHGQDAKRLPHLDVAVHVGDTLEIADMVVDILPADGHTIGHIAYYFESERALFTADSLMIWGCGRLFEGTPEQMWETLDGFARLPEDTLVFSGHNYAEANGRFALSLGGYPERMQARMEKINAQNAAGEPVCPVELREELRSNPFYLVREDEYAQALGIEDLSEVERFAHVRKLKDNF